MLSNRNLVRFLCILMVVITISVLAGCSSNTNKDSNEQKSQGSKETITLKIAHYLAVEHPVNQVLNDQFKTTVEEGSEGRIKVEVYPASQLGDEQEFIEGVQTGSIEMAITGNMWENTIPQFKIVQLPYMFINYEHADEVLNGPIGDQIYQYLEDGLNVKVIGSFPNGFRVVSNNVRPIENLEDCKGLRIRVFEGEIIVKEIDSLGLTPVVMPMSETFTAIQQGVVDGIELPLSIAHPGGYYEVQKYVAITNHMFTPGYMVINGDIWNKLSEADQELITEAASEAMKEIKEKIEDNDNKIIEDIKSKGLEVTYPDIKPFMDSVQWIIEEYVEQQPEVEEIIKEIQQSGKKYI